MTLTHKNKCYESFIFIADLTVSNIFKVHAYMSFSTTPEALNIALSCDGTQSLCSR